MQQDDISQAEAYLREGLSVAREIGSRELISDLLTYLGASVNEQQDYTQAEEYLQEGLTLARQIRASWQISNIPGEFGELYLKQQCFEEAAAAFREALEQVSAGSQKMKAFALYGLARVVFAQGDISLARQQGQKSLDLFEAVGHRKASEVRQWLDALPD